MPLSRELDYNSDNLVEVHGFCRVKCDEWQPGGVHQLSEGVFGLCGGMEAVRWEYRLPAGWSGGMLYRECFLGDNMDNAGEHKKQTEGFTLTEIVIASSILALVFVGFLMGLVQAIRTQYMSNRNYAASVIARNRVEYAKVYAYGSLSLLAETATPVDRNGNDCATGTFWRTTMVQASTPNPQCTEVKVSVIYETKPGITSPAPVEVSTILGD